MIRNVDIWKKRKQEKKVTPKFEPSREESRNLKSAPKKQMKPNNLTQVNKLMEFVTTRILKFTQVTAKDCP